MSLFIYTRLFWHLCRTRRLFWHLCRTRERVKEHADVRLQQTAIDSATHFNILQHTATTSTQCNRLCNTLQHIVIDSTTHCNTLQRTATHCNTLHHTATHCNTLHHTAPHCTTLQHNWESMRAECVKRDLFTWKETYKRNLLTVSPSDIWSLRAIESVLPCGADCVKRNLLSWKETYKKDLLIRSLWYLIAACNWVCAV